jgi:hypothetical protein
MSSYGKRVQAQRDAVASLNESTTRVDLLDKIVAAHDEGVENALVIAARPLVDYQFFQLLTSRADAAKTTDKAEATRLERLRDRLVDLSATLDRAAREALNRGAQTLRDILNHQDVREGVRHHAGAIDDAFVTVLSMNLQAAQQQGRRDAFEALRQVWDELQNMMEEGAPPEVRLLNQLMRAAYPEGTRALLTENRSQVTEEFLQTLDRVAAQMDAEQDAESAKRLRAIRAQAVLMA